MKYSMLTTEDNPFDPFDEYENWKRFDQDHGYYTENYLMRVCPGYSTDLSDAELAQCVEDGIDEILFFNLTGNYKKVTRDIEGLTSDSD